MAKQETMDDWFQDAKDLAKAEKDLNIIPYIYISYELVDRKGEKSVLHEIEIPRSMYDRWMWLLEWRKAKYVCKYPRERVTMFFSYFDKTTGLKYGWKSRLSSLASTKAQITKVERAIAAYVEEQKKNNLFFNQETDPILIKAYDKLACKKENYAKLKKSIEEEVKGYLSTEKHQKTSA